MSNAKGNGARTGMQVARLKKDLKRAREERDAALLLASARGNELDMAVGSGRSKPAAEQAAINALKALGHHL